jgi:FtsP/CotA-like multicopper oxidase with cupredoxin domain
MSQQKRSKPSPAHTAPRQSALSRRKLLLGLGGVGVGSALAGSALRFASNASAATATGTLNIPTLLSAADDNGVSVFTLSAQTGTSTLVSGVSSSTAGYNGSYLGPVLKVSNGEQVRMAVTNNLSAETTVHWHGLHAPPSVDGGPQNIIAAGGTWTPEFTVNQGACTLWFHPHALTTTAAQVASGLAGMIIVDDDTDGAAALPQDYGVNQFPLIVQSVPVRSTGVIQSSTAGLTSTSTSFPLIVNGVNAATATPTLAVDENRIRFHLLNGSIADIITISRTDGGTMTQVATDAALLPSPTAVTSVRLVAGERAEIVLDLSGTVTLQATVTAGGARGGSGTTSIVSITTTDTTVRDALPATLNTITALDSTSATARTIALSNSGNTMMINGVAGTTMAAMATNEIMTTLNAVEVWTITNATNLLHSFHLHDVPFQVLAVNGSAPTGLLSGTWKDTIEMPAQSTRKIVMQFTDYSDDTYAYMLHCHNAIHEDEGMMTMLMVMAA